MATAQKAAAAKSSVPETGKPAPAAPAAATQAVAPAPAPAPAPATVKAKVAKPASKPAPAPKASPKAKPAVKSVAKPAAKPTVPAKAVAKPAAAKPEKVKKPKMARDSFTIPKAEYVVLDDLKQRAATLKRPVKKSELLRAGIKALAAMNGAAFLAALGAVPAIKTGRPKQD
jgi:hypothetical protein